ncbi:MAG: fibronectin type III domain-containing protein [Bacteroidia bacterium]|nr:fibronectin type III domain-containing protein [Bacteroidia bacterium]MDW8158791.1 fibronectin type III domain-containing protein [Bacteroidia bacterium]
MNLRYFVVILLLAVALGASSFAQKVHPDYWDGVVYLRVKKNRTLFLYSQKSDVQSLPPKWQEIIKKYKVVSIQKASTLPYPELQAYYKLLFDNHAQVYALMKELSSFPEIELVEQRPIDRIVSIPNDPYYSLQWALHRINAPHAWSLTTGLSTIMIAIVDDGVRTTHQDLAPKVVAGWDVADGDPDPNPPIFRTTNTTFSHGTHCAGIAAAVTNNGIGIASIGYNVSILPVKCTRDNTDDPDVISHGYEGIEYAISRGAHVISLSWGSYRTFIYGQDLINRAVNNGIVVVGAAGNDNVSSKMYPAAYENVICVGATDSHDKKASFSNYGSHIDIMAPGTNILSTVATTNSSYATYNGTSMAAPLVAGLAALILSYRPGISPAGVEECIKNTAVDILPLNPGFAGQIGGGRIDAGAAMLCRLTTPECRTDPFEPNNTLPDAKNFPATAYGYICPVGDVDWFRFTLSTTASFTVTLTNLPADYDIQLYDANNQLLRESDNWGTSSERISMSAAAPGTYFLRIVGYDGAFNARLPYTLNLSIAGSSTNQCPTPLIRQTTNLTSTTAQINWTAVQGASSYTILYRAQNSPTWQSVTANTNFFLLQQLLPQTTYEFQVRSNCSDGTSSVYSSIGIFTTLESNCASPNLLNFSNVTSTSASFSWQAVAGATSYNLRYAVEGSENWVVISVSTNTATVSNLSPATRYIVQVQAVCDASKSVSAFSAGINFTTLPAVQNCLAPSKIWVTNILPNSATINWEAVNGANFYTVEYREPGGNWQQLTVSSTTAVINGLSASTLYEYRIQSLCTNSVSPYSAIQTFTTLSGQSCSTPTSLQASSVSDNTATISWSPVMNAINYEILYRVQGTNNWINLTSPTSRIVLTGLSPSTTYDFFVRAVCSNVASGYSPLFNFTTSAAPVTVCFPPTNVSVSSITSSSAVISWSTVTTAIQYLFKYRIAGSSSWNHLSTTITSITLNNLQPSTPYEYQVEAICSAGQSASSGTFTFTTLSLVITECLVPTNLRLLGVTNNSATIVWSAVPSANSYNIAYRTQGLANWSTSTITSNSITLTSLTNGTVYEFYVQAICNGSHSSYTPAFIFSTLVSPSRIGASNEANFSIYPNPANQFITIQGENLEGTQITVRDLLGKILLEHVVPSSVNTDTYQLSISHLSAGTYYLILSKENHKTIRKLQVMK